MATIGIMNVLAREGERAGILVNAISPVAKTRMWGCDGDPDELRPDAVAPGAVYLVSPAHHESGWILRASNGQFRAVRMTEADGVNYPRDLQAVAAKDAEEVSVLWQQIAVPLSEARINQPVSRMVTA